MRHLLLLCCLPLFLLTTGCRPSPTPESETADAPSANDPIDDAVAKNDAEAVLYYAQQNPRGIAWRDEAENTLVHRTVESPAILRAILPLKPDLAARNIAGYQALHFAVKLGNLESIRLLLEAGARVQARVGINAEDQAQGECTLMHVAWIEDAATATAVADLIHGLDPDQLNIRGPDGFTPLMYAIDQGNLAFARWLLSKGADRTLLNDGQQDALAFARWRIEDNKSQGLPITKDDQTILELLAQ